MGLYIRLAFNMARKIFHQIVDMWCLEYIAQSNPHIWSHDRQTV